MRRLASPVPSTAGRPNSRATIEPWARTPPTSVTRPRAWEKSGVQAGVVVGHTRIVPGSIREKSDGERITLAGALTRPGLTAKPLRIAPVGSLCRCVSQADMSIGPNRSLWPGGTTGGGCSRLRASLNQPSRQLECQSPQGGPAGAHVEERLLAVRAEALCPAEQDPEQCPEERVKRTHRLLYERIAFGDDGSLAGSGVVAGLLHHRLETE